MGLPGCFLLLARHGDHRTALTDLGGVCVSRHMGTSGHAHSHPESGFSGSAREVACWLERRSSRSLWRSSFWALGAAPKLPDTGVETEQMLVGGYGCRDQADQDQADACGGSRSSRRLICVLVRCGPLRGERLLEQSGTLATPDMVRASPVLCPLRIGDRLAGVDGVAAPGEGLKHRDLHGRIKGRELPAHRRLGRCSLDLPVGSCPRSRATPRSW